MWAERRLQTQPLWWRECKSTVHSLGVPTVLVCAPCRTRTPASPCSRARPSSSTCTRHTARQPRNPQKASCPVQPPLTQPTVPPRARRRNSARGRPSGTGTQPATQKTRRWLINCSELCSARRQPGDDASGFAGSCREWAGRQQAQADAGEGVASSKNLIAAQHDGDGLWRNAARACVQRS